MLGRARWVLCTVFSNQGAVAQHDNLTKNWVCLNLVVHSQFLWSVENKELLTLPCSYMVENPQNQF